MKKKILTLPLLLLMIVACTTEKEVDQSENTAKATLDADDLAYPAMSQQIKMIFRVA